MSEAICGCFLVCYGLGCRYAHPGYATELFAKPIAPASTEVMGFTTLNPSCELFAPSRTMHNAVCYMSQHWTETKVLRIPATFIGAIVKLGGGVRGPDETGISLVGIERENGEPLFGEYRPIFAENENDFSFEIGRFGYLSRQAAGSTSPAMRCKFSSDEIDYIQSILIPFFSDVESLSNWMPFFLTKGRPLLGVKFTADWILNKANFSR